MLRIGWYSPIQTPIRFLPRVDFLGEPDGPYFVMLLIRGIHSAERFLCGGELSQIRSAVFVRFLAQPFPTRHCEGVKRPKQSGTTRFFGIATAALLPRDDGMDFIVLHALVFLARAKHSRPYMGFKDTAPVTIRLLVAGLFLYAFLAAPTVARATSDDSPKTLPRFASLKDDKVYARTGPSPDYPIRWVYERAGLPVEIVHQYDHWRRIRDSDGDEGWVHVSLLSSRRMAIIRPQDMVALRAKPETDSPIVFKAQPGAILRIDSCRVDSCRLAHGHLRGWIDKDRLWGVYPAEEFD